MLKKIKNYMRKRERADISRRLDHVYADMRLATERAKVLKRFAEYQEAQSLHELKVQEQKLIAKAKHIDSEELHSSIPTRNARAW